MRTIVPIAITITLLACGNAAEQTASSDEDLTFDQFEQHNLSVVNSYRATKGVAPLKLVGSLTKFAIAGSKELEQDHVAHEHFENAVKDGTIWNDGFKTMAAENQGDPYGWPQLVVGDETKNELEQIDAIQKMMFQEGPGGGHYDNMMNPSYHRVGVGLVRASGGKLYLTNDFSD